MSTTIFEDRIVLKRDAVREAMRKLECRLKNGDESELVYWVKPGELACTVRPLRWNQIHGGSRQPISADARPLVDDWVTLIKVENIQGILSLMHDADLECYRDLGFPNENLHDYLTGCGFDVASCPYEDPHHKKSTEEEKLETLLRVREEALIAYRKLAKPSLIMCSAGIDRSAPVAAFIDESEDSGRS